MTTYHDRVDSVLNSARDAEVGVDSIVFAGRLLGLANGSGDSVVVGKSAASRFSHDEDV